MTNQIAFGGNTVTVVLTNPNMSTTYYNEIAGLNVVSWSNSSIMLSSIRQGFKCGGGTLVFKPCKSWVSFALDSSNVLSSADFQTQLSFVSNAISEINHSERLQLVYKDGILADWYGPFSIPYIQNQMNSIVQNGSFTLDGIMHVILSSYLQTFAVSNSIGAVVFVSDTSSPSNYEGADDVVNFLKILGFKLTFVLMGPNVDQSKLTRYTNNFITWNNLNNSQPDNWDNVYRDAYACPK